MVCHQNASLNRHFAYLLCNIKMSTYSWLVLGMGEFRSSSHYRKKRYGLYFHLCSGFGIFYFINTVQSDYTDGDIAAGYFVTVLDSVPFFSDIFETKKQKVAHG